MSRADSIRVNLLCEDRTGKGLPMLIEKATQARRSMEDKPPIAFPRRFGTVLNNHKLIEECAKYTRLRFHTGPRYDHVFYVIDAYRAWDLGQIDIAPPQRNADLHAYVEDLSVALRTAMTRKARGDDYSDDAVWDPVASGFHPHVLVWERESLMLPVSDALGLGEPPADPFLVRHPAQWIKERYGKHHPSKSYEKSIHGPELLGRIANDAGLRQRVLDAIPSLCAIVDELTSL